MNKFALRPLVAALVLSAPVMSAFATDGYFSHGYGMKAKGMGGAAAASTDNAFAGANNPATSAFAGNRIEAGVDMFMPDRGMSRTGASNSPQGMQSMTVDSNSNSFAIPEFAFNKAHDNKISYGLTVYGNGGMNTDYARNPVGNPTTRMGVDLSQLIVAPTLAYKINADQSIGISPLLVYQQMNVDGIAGFGPFSTNQNKLSNKGTDTSTGLGVRLGYFAKLTPKLNLGAAYSPKIKMSSFDNYSGLFASSFDIPENYTLGMSFQASESVKLALDYQRINYADVPAIGNSTSAMNGCMALVMGGGAPNSGCLGGANGPGFGWQNINVIKLGAEWKVSPKLTLRAGYNHSDNPIKSADVTFNIMAPGVVTKHYTLGGTYELSSTSEVTLAYMKAPRNSVSGRNLFNDGNETIGMSQQSLGIQFGWKF